MKKRLLAIALLLLPLWVAAQVEFKASAPQSVRVGEQFQLTYTINANGSRLVAPSFEGFDYLGLQQGTTIVNGAVTQSFTYVLRARQQGDYVIAPAKIESRGRTYASNPVTIKVLAGSAPNAAPGRADSNNAGSGSPDVFAGVTLNKRQVYVGEPLVATMEIYSALSLTGFQDVSFPDFTGFWAEQIESPSQIDLRRTTLNGKEYGVGMLQKTALFPQRSGQVTIDAFEVVAEVREPTGRYDWWGRPLTQSATKTVRSEPQTITVLPLPEEGKPQGFNGAVGSFRLKVEIDQTKVQANSAITLTVTLSGSGNLKLVEPPKIEFPQGFEVYDPEVKNEFTVSAAGLEGSRVLTYLVIPRQAGVFTLPAIRFSYFDPQQRKYFTVSSEDFVLNIDAGQEQASTSTVVNKQTVEGLAEDIRFLKPGDLGLRPSGRGFFRSLPFYMSYGLSSLAFVGFILFRKKKASDLENVAELRYRRAAKVTRKRLKTAEEHLRALNSELFYAELLSASWGYLSDKFGVPASALSREVAIEKFQEKGIPESLSGEFLEVIDACEFARYAPSTDNSQMDMLFRKASDVFNRIEHQSKS